MKSRSFRVFAEKEDLLNIFNEFQSKLEVYYVPTYSDAGKTSYKSIMDLENLGINFYGSHNGNKQMLILPKGNECLWKAYQCKGNNNQYITRYTTLGIGNTSYICVDFNGIYQENSIFPTEINTLYYDDNSSKTLYDELKRIIGKQAVVIKNGYYICPKAYENKEKYRFCTININSPNGYDLSV